MSGTLAIPASQIVNVIPSVLSAGGNALDLSGMFLTSSTRVPIGAVLSFETPTDVGLYFGLASTEAALASTYFLGYDNSTQKPGSVLFTQYNQAPVGAWTRGAPTGLSLTQLQALTGTIIVTLDGVVKTSSPINLSSATSFSNAAELMSIGLGVVGSQNSTITGAINGITLTVTSVSAGTINIGDEVRGGGTAAGTVVSSYLTGTGGQGTYGVSISQNVSSASLTTNTPTVTYDAVSGAFLIASSTTGGSSTINYATGTLSPAIGLTQASGAVISQGVVAAVPASFMTNAAIRTQNWASFTTIVDLDLVGSTGNTVKQAFAAWTNAQGNRYAYIAWDSDVTPTLSGNATASLGAILNASQSSGTTPFYSPTQGPTMAAFMMGSIASVDFNATNGRPTFAFKGQSGIVPDVTSATVAQNLISNGYNFYGAYATANDVFNFLNPGQISGQFQWIDSYINQIWLNNQFQLALMELLTNIPSIPYNDVGYSFIRAALKDPIDAGLNYGAFRAGVTLSNAQAVEVNNAAGKKIDDVLSQQGWYLQISPATPQVRAARGSPPCMFWYMDGEAIQKLTLASIEVQ